MIELRELVEGDEETEGVGRAKADPEAATGTMGVSSSAVDVTAAAPRRGGGAFGSSGLVIGTSWGGDINVGELVPEIELLAGTKRLGSTTTLLVATSEFITGIEIGFIELEISDTSGGGGGGPVVEAPSKTWVASPDLELSTVGVEVGVGGDLFVRQS